MNDQELIEFVKGNLGEPQIKVELESSQWDKVLLGTKKWFLAKKGIVGSKQMYFETKIPKRFSEIDPVHGVDTVIDVLFGLDPAMSGFYHDCVFGVFTNGFPVIGSSVFRTNVGLGSSSRFAQMMSALEERSRTYGAEYDFWTMPSPDYDGNDWLIIDGPSNAVKLCAVIFKPRLKPSEMNMEWLKARDIELATRYAIAEAKEILGHIRRKYSGYQTPGGEVSLDGEALLTEAKEAKEILDKEIYDSQGPIPFITG